MTTFKYSREAQHAESLRVKRDLTVKELAASEFWHQPDSKAYALAEKMKAKDHATLTRWVREAAKTAVEQVMVDAAEASQFSYQTEDTQETVYVSTLDLEGATITVTIADLVATAVLVVPDRD